MADEEIEASHLTLLGWREVPTDDGALGDDALARLPVMRQVLLGRPEGLDDNAFERLLYLTRKRLERRLFETQLGNFYIPSFSHRTVAYKGLMVAPQLPSFYHDLADPDFETSIAVFHQRYSTNTMPRWSLAQPFRFLAHNGEINTLQGNVNFMRAREAVLESALWGDDIKELLPIIAPGGSDSAALDNAFELLVLSGRDPMQALMMLVPEAYEELDNMAPDVRAFYEYHGTLMEPWDGPAALALTDGRFAVAAIDRNGLRPQRYWLAEDGIVVVGSEAGMVPLGESNIVEKGKLEPGSILVVDTLKGVLLRNDEVKARVSAQYPYGEWLAARMVRAPTTLRRKLTLMKSAPARGTKRPCCARKSCSVTVPKITTVSSARWPRPVTSPSARWATTRRSRFCPSSRRACTATLSSGLLRSPTHRLTRCVNAW